MGSINLFDRVAFQDYLSIIITLFLLARGHGEQNNTFTYTWNANKSNIIDHGCSVVFMNKFSLHLQEVSDEFILMASLYGIFIIYSMRTY